MTKHIIRPFNFAILYRPIYGGRLQRQSKPFRSFARETFFSAAPIACGSYAASLRLVPVGDPPPADNAHD
jgi:hypothetical protein